MFTILFKNIISIALIFEKYYIFTILADKCKKKRKNSYCVRNRFSRTTTVW